MEFVLYGGKAVRDVGPEPAASWSPITRVTSCAPALIHFLFSTQMSSWLEEAEVHLENRLSGWPVPPYLRPAQLSDRARTESRDPWC